MLTTLTIVKGRLKLPEADVADDELLEQIIALVSARFENEANRKFGYAAQEDEFQGDEMELRLSRYPLDTEESVAFALKSDEATGWETQASVGYVVRKGCVLSLRGRVGSENEVMRVTYSGGYKLPETDEGSVELPDDLGTQACEQAVFIYQNKDRLGVRTMSTAGGSLTVDGLDLLPSAVAVLRKYERWAP